MLLALLAHHDTWAGVPAAAAVPLARRALAQGTLIKAEPSGYGFLLAAAVLVIADEEDALTVFDDALAEAHRRGSILAFAITKAFRALTYVVRGDLGEAERDGREALEALETWGATARFGDVVAASLAETLIEQGELDEAAAVLERVASADLPDTVRRLYFLESRARLRMLRGDLAGGLEETFEIGRVFESVGGRNPAVIAWRSHAALALRRLGDADEARRLAREELALARTWGAPRALGGALRVAGLVAGGEVGLALLEEAVDVLADSPAKLEHAKARTELGAALRRANRRSEARAQLRRALELATICGAAPLVQQAEEELLATGARPRRIPLRGVESLTPSERRVAEMAARGPTNREIAQALFVTPKTVEVHLSSVYRKLGIASRAQLPAALADSAHTS